MKSQKDRYEIQNRRNLFVSISVLLLFFSAATESGAVQNGFHLATNPFSTLTFANPGESLESTAAGSVAGHEPGLISRLQNAWSKLRVDGKFSGWASVGYHDGNNGLFNSHPGGVNLHQLWFTYEKEMSIAQGDQSWGYRVDVIYGVDAADVQSFGNHGGRWDYQNGFSDGKNGWAVPQLYVQGHSGKFEFKLGHFLSPAGYETVSAPHNFFYSHSQTMKSSQPRSHTGILTSLDVKAWKVYLGWTLGWDTGFDQLNQGSNGLIGFSKKLSDDVALTYMNTVGNLGWRGHGYSQSIVLDFVLNEKWDYVLQSDFVNTSTSTDSGDDIGITNYLFYTVSDCWQLGTRIEWWRDNQVTKNSITIGANWRLKNGLGVIRPEVRSDWVPGLNSKQTVFAVDAIVEF